MPKSSATPSESMNLLSEITAEPPTKKRTSNISRILAALDEQEAQQFIIALNDGDISSVSIVRVMNRRGYALSIDNVQKWRRQRDA
jgi:hypothetical protein